MVTRSMKANGHYCIRFPTGLPDKKRKQVPKECESNQRKRIRIVYRNSYHVNPIAKYVHFIVSIIAYTYCFVLYANVFWYIYTHYSKPEKKILMIAY